MGPSEAGLENPKVSARSSTASGALRGQYRPLHAGVILQMSVLGPQRHIRVSIESQRQKWALRGRFGLSEVGSVP